MELDLDLIDHDEHERWIIATATHLQLCRFLGRGQYERFGPFARVEDACEHVRLYNAQRGTKYGFMLYAIAVDRHAHVANVKHDGTLAESYRAFRRRHEERKRAGHRDNRPRGD